MAEAVPVPAAPVEKSLTRATAAGVVWLVLQNVGGRGIGLLSQLVTAALLSPKDFGLIGLTYTVSGLGGMLVSFGIDSVLLQRRNKLQLWVGPAFWWTLGLGMLGFLLVLAISPLAALAYGAPGIPLLAGIIAISTPLTALQTVPLALLRTRLGFRTIATINLAEIIGTQAITVLLAFAGFGAMSFAIPLPITAAAKSALMWRITKPDVRGGLARLRRFRLLFRDSSAVFGTNLIQSLTSQGDYITLGLFATDAVVGTYYFAFKMASQPMMLMATSLTSVLFPALTKLRARPREQGAGAIRAARIIGLIGMPMAFLQAGVIPQAIHIFFVSKWDASIPLMQILSIGLAFDAITWVSSALLTSRGGFRTQLVYLTRCVPIFFTLVVIGAATASALGAAIAVAIYYLLVSPALSYVVFRKEGLSLPRLLVIYLAPALMAAVSIAGAIAATHALQVSGDLRQIVVIPIIFAVIYIALVRLLDPAGFGELRSLGLGMIKR